MFLVTTNSALLKSLRVAAKKTQQQVADELGINKQQYAKYEQRQQEPRVSMGQKIAKAIGTNLDVVADFFAND